VHVAILGNVGSWYCAALERAAISRGHQSTRVDFRRLCASVTSSTTSLVGSDIELASLDAVIVRTMPPGSLEQVVFRMDALARIEATGIEVLNPPKAIECDVVR